MTKRMHMDEQLRYDVASGREPNWTIASGYSTSAHLPMLEHMVWTMRARRVAEVGCGRSTVVLDRAARQIGASFFSCDRYDYRWLFPGLFVGKTKEFWGQFPASHFQVIFLDHLSSKDYSVADVDCEIAMAWTCLSKPGILMIHDAGNPKYAVSQSRWIKKGCVLPFGHSLAIIVKGKWSLENEPWPKCPDTTEVKTW